MKAWFQANAPVVRFLVLAGFMYGGWHLAYTHHLRPETQIDEWVIQQLVDGTERGLAILGLPAHSYVQPESHANRVGLQGKAGVKIGEPCDGMDVFALFALFIVAFPGSWKHKLWFIPAGVVFLHGANLLRVLALTIVQGKAPEWLDFSHDYAFKVLMYALVFGLWYAWTALTSKSVAT